MEYQKTELHRPISIFDGNISDAYPIIQKAKKVYLPNGLVDLRYLYRHDGHPESLVVAPDWIASSTLLIELFGRDRIISIGEEPSVSGRPLPADERRILFESLEKQANALLSTFEHIGADAELIAFTQFNVFPWYVLIGLFRRMGASIRYIDIHQRWLQMISLKGQTGELGKHMRCTSPNYLGSPVSECRRGYMNQSSVIKKAVPLRASLQPRERD